MTISQDCSSNKTEEHLVFKHLQTNEKTNQGIADFNEKENNSLSFFDLFLMRYKQVCKERKTVKLKDLKDYTDNLSKQAAPPRRRNAITSFDDILKF